MSRLAQPKSSPVSKRDPRLGGGGGGAQDEICPVCKSSRYLNANLRFLINPECYHKMCESCVDRIFGHGPAQCPIPGCRKTLRRARFRVQTFEDLLVEREVDIRKRVQAVFNKREEEFESLRAYNDYLNEVEDITFNLINGIDVEETEERFTAYEKAHEKEIAENEQLAEQEKLSFTAMQKQERQQARERRAAARREEEEERRELEANRRDVLQRLAAGQDPDSVARQGQEVQLKKRLDRQAAVDRQRQLHAAADVRKAPINPVIKGLKAKTKPVEPEPPIDPFGGLQFVDKYFTLQDDYVWDGIQEAKRTVPVVAGGYDVRDYTQKSLCAAFSGLGVFIADEMAERDKTVQESEGPGSESTVIGMQDSKMTDVL